MIRWAVVEMREVAHITLYDSYNEALTEASILHATEHDKLPDRLTVELLSCGIDHKLESLFCGYDVLKGKEYLSFKKLLEISGLKMKHFSNAYGIPYRTVQNWAAGEEPQMYMLSLLAIAIFTNKGVDI